MCLSASNVPTVPHLMREPAPRRRQSYRSTRNLVATGLLALRSPQRKNPVRLHPESSCLQLAPMVGRVRDGRWVQTNQEIMASITLRKTQSFRMAMRSKL